MLRLLLALISWFGQTAPRSAFEVATIKPAPATLSNENLQSGQVHVGINIDGGRADYGFMTLADLIPYAYRVTPHQVSGPAGMNDTRWDIAAKIPEGQPAALAPEMMQSLLADRFKLSVHRETRERPVYALAVGKGGLKIKEASVADEAAADPAPLFSMPGVSVRLGPNGVVQMRMAQISMAALAGRLTQFMDRPVVDVTELKGNYQVTLDLPVEAMAGMAFGQKVSVLAGLGSFVEGSDAAIIQAMMGLGFELQSRKASIETIIVDRWEKTPTPN